jgi:hypothetical protein
MTLGGYVTETREVPGFTKPISTTHWGVEDKFVKKANQTNSSRYTLPEQTTYSYRTRGKSMTSQEYDFSQHRNLAGVNRQLRTEHRRRNTGYDTGHEFSTSKETFRFKGSTLRRATYNPYHGVCYLWVVPNPYDSQHGAASLPALTPLSNMGARAIRDTMPTSSPADLAEALFELKREGLPKFFQNSSMRKSVGKKKTAKRDRKGRTRLVEDNSVHGSVADLTGAVASGHLAKEFGLDPILRSIKDASDAILDSAKILEKYYEEAGRKIHRSRRFAEEVATTPVYEHTSAFLNTNLGMYVPSASVGLPFGRWPQSTSSTRNVNTWFSGAYTYYVDDVERHQNRIRDFLAHAEYLLGLEIDASLAWELMPWSWLIDWVSSIGTNIANAIALDDDSVVLRYGYVMRETKIVSTYQTVRLRDYYGPVDDPYVQFQKVWKVRMRASPYGFGLDTSSFTARQWSILAALGMTKSTGTLRYNE